MANIYRGVGVHWGVGTTTAIVAFGTFKLQTRDYSKKSEMETLKDSTGVTVAKIYYDPTEEATFEYIPSAASGGVAAPTLPAIGDLITVVDTVSGVAGTTWLCDDVSTKSSNTSCMRVTVRMTKYPEIAS